MDTRFIGRITPGQKVRDSDRNVLGKVAHVYREDVTSGPPQLDDVLEVKQGLFGMGQRLFIPVSVVNDATEEEVQLEQVSEQAEMQWRSKPSYFERLT